MKLIDSHCHLNYDFLPKTTDDLIREAENEGVQALVTIGTDLSSISEIQKISEKYPAVYHTIGIHPHDTAGLNDKGMQTLESAARHPKCRAIGEIGLDYHYNHSPKEVQIFWLKKQLELAIRLKLPVVIHSREGEEDLLRALTEFASRFTSLSTTIQIPGVIHCFTGTLEFGQRCLELGFLISFSGILTFKKAEEVHVAARTFPLDRLMIETDSPYLAPIPFRGKKCEPSMVKFTAQKLAEIKGVTFEKVAQATTLNAQRFFRLELT